MLGVALLLCVLLLAGCGESDEPAATAPAVTTPTTSEAHGGLTPEQLPDLALSVDDLPAGFTMRREGEVPAASPIVAGFRRAFDPGDTRLGESLVADLTSDVALFGSSDEAAAALAGILSSLVGETVDSAFAEVIRDATGIEATNLQGQTLASETLGDGAVVASATFDTDAGRAEAVLVIVRVGPLHQAVFVIGPAGDVRVDDAVELAEAVIPRLRGAVEGEFAA
jgi:hypothetical protein